MPNQVKTERVSGDHTVIVADRHPFARAALAALLSYDGYRVFQAQNFPMALSYIDQLPNLAVLIADLDSPEWRSIVRYTVKTTSALVIAMEGNHSYSEMYDLKARGIQICLKKPITYSDVQHAIRQYLGARELGEGPAAGIAARSA
jgi:CheY-like chemotaxis protein